jgi:hypothetical protein
MPARSSATDVRRTVREPASRRRRKHARLLSSVDRRFAASALPHPSRERMRSLLIRSDLPCWAVPAPRRVAPAERVSRHQILVARHCANGVGCR